MPTYDLSGSVSAVSSVSGTIDSEYVEAVNSTDDPLFRTHNLKWLENSPSDGFVRWESLDGINPILVLFGNEVYEITPAQTAFTHIFWRLESPNNIVASNDEPDINGVDVFPLAKNTDGIVDAAWGLRIIDTKRLAENAITKSASAYTEGALEIDNADYTIIQTVDLTTSGGVIEISAAFLPMYDSYFQICRGATPVVRSANQNMVAVGGQWFSFSLFINSPAEEETYTLKAKKSDAGVTNCYFRQLSVIEIRK